MIKKINDETRSNITKLIDLYTEYREMQYTLLKQFDVLLEDAKFDVMYVSVEPLIKYREYIEASLNGSKDLTNTTGILKEFKNLLDVYDNSLKNTSKEVIESIQ